MSFRWPLVTEYLIFRIGYLFLDLVCENLFQWAVVCDDWILIGCCLREYFKLAVVTLLGAVSVHSCAFLFSLCFFAVCCLSVST